GLVTRGLRANLQEGRYVYGGSTVSQQLVKNLFLRREKTVGRKVEEAMLTWLMERSVPKWRILELYLNMVEFGPDVWGVAQASWHYFGRPADELTPLEAAFLAALKPAPREGDVYRRRGNSPMIGWWPERLQTLLERLHEHGAFLSMKEARAFAPYVVALRRDDAVLGDAGAILGSADGSVTRIDLRANGAPAAWWPRQATTLTP
ncbi:MAG: membrane peptidoglycan carboxypeptidase, partial [Bradymonadia bacterium]